MKPLALVAVALVASCVPTHRPTPTPTPPGAVNVEGVGIVTANAGVEDPREHLGGIASLGVRHVRLSAYYREPWSLQRTIREAWVADSLGLTVLVDVQATPSLYPERPSLEGWVAAWDTLAAQLPPNAVISVGNEANAEHWWPWGRDLFLEFWNEAHKVAKANGRTFGGPHLAGDWPGAMAWLRWLLANGAQPDVLIVHYYGPNLDGWMRSLPWSGRVWLGETSRQDGTEAQRLEYQRRAIAGRWERTYLYDWVGDPAYRIRGTGIEEMLRQALGGTK